MSGLFSQVGVKISASKKMRANLGTGHGTVNGFPRFSDTKSSFVA
jgi:hypothetical protein